MTNKRILYLHGLGGNPDTKAIKKLEGQYDVVAPKLDYENPGIWTGLQKLVDKMNPDGIIGHSLGGYLAYYLSNNNHIPALLFNPAFNDEDLFLIPIPQSITEMSPYGQQMAIIGKDDDVINPNDQLNALKLGNADVYIENIGHDIPDDLFDFYCNKFINRDLSKNEAVIRKMVQEFYLKKLQ